MININKVKQTPLIQRERKIFLNNMNSWFSNFVIESLRTESVTDKNITKNEFMGTRNSSKMKLPHLFEPTEIKIDYNFHFEHEIFKNDVFIYNLEDSDYNEIEYIIKGLKTLRHASDKVLIIISSIMTWARTPQKIKKEKTDENDDNLDDKIQVEESEDEEVIEDFDMDMGDDGGMDVQDSKMDKEPPKKYLPFKDKDFILRIPSKKYYHYKMIETLALAAASTNLKLKTYIICPGFIYGCGEDLFYDYFKMAWLINPYRLPVIGDGKNSIPTIHINDLVNLIKRIIEKQPKIRYIFAVDRTKNRSLKNIIKSISKSTGSGEIENIVDFNAEQVQTIPAYNELTINVKCKTSKVFDDEKRDDEDQEDFEKRCFKWHCEFGIPENLELLRKEFTGYRNLKALRILVTGPPASGKTVLSERLSKFLNLPHLKITDILEYGQNLPKTDELGEEIRTKIEELKDKMIEEWEEAQKKVKGKRKNEPPIDRNSLHPKLPDEIIVTILKRKLRENLCRNRGYILDGYPRSFADAQLAFTDIDPNKPEDDPRTLLDDILPNSVVRLDQATDDYLKHRIKMLPELSLQGTHYTDEAMTRRLTTYRNFNESTKGDLSLSDFLSKNGVEILPIDCKLEVDAILNKTKIFLERNGPIQNYQKFDDDEKIVIKEKFEEKIKLEKVEEEREKNENEGFENQKQEEKKDYNEAKLKQLKERERQLLEKKSEVLRRYLHENVIPILSKGIMEVCKELPNDPVDFLADFLFENSMKVKFPPTKYKDN